MTEGMTALLLGVLAILYAILSTTSTKKIIENTNKFLEKMKQEALEAQKRHEEILNEWRKKMRKRKEDIRKCWNKWTKGMKNCWSE